MSSQGIPLGELPQSLHDAVDLGKKVKKVAYAMMDEAGVPGILADPVSSYVGMIPLIGGFLFVAVLSIIKDVIVPTAVAGLQVHAQLRRDAAPQLAEVAGAVMGEFLGFEVDPAQLSTAEGFEGNVSRAATLGGALHDLLTREFTQGGDVTPDTGAAAARIFSGYNINFSAQNAIMSLFFDMASIHQAEGIRELGVETATNLGLGRLHRQAMKPLIDNLIVKPYTKFMNRKYQQQSLTEPQLCQAYLAGGIDRQYLTIELEYLGYPSFLHDVIVGFYTPQMTVQEVWALVKHGDVTADEGVNLLRKQGWSTDFARNKLAAVTAEHELRLEGKVQTELESLVKERYMTTDEYALELRKLHLYDEEIELLTRVTGTYLEHQYRHFTLAEVLYMVEHNIITEQAVDDWAASIGFNEEDRLTLSLWFAQKELDYEAAVQAKKDAAAKKKAAATPKPPTTPPASGG